MQRWDVILPLRGALSMTPSPVSSPERGLHIWVGRWPRRSSRHPLLPLPPPFSVPDGIIVLPVKSGCHPPFLSP